VKSKVGVALSRAELERRLQEERARSARLEHQLKRREELQQEIKDLTRKIPKLSGAAKRQAAPFARRCRKPHRAKPGRKRVAQIGLRVPERLEEPYQPSQELPGAHGASRGAWGQARSRGRMTPVLFYRFRSIRRHARTRRSRKRSRGRGSRWRRRRVALEIGAAPAGPGLCSRGGAGAGDGHGHGGLDVKVKTAFVTYQRKRYLASIRRGPVGYLRSLLMLPSRTSPGGQLSTRTLGNFQFVKVSSSRRGTP
jgi:hypothetical protein